GPNSGPPAAATPRHHGGPPRPPTGSPPPESPKPQDRLEKGDPPRQPGRRRSPSPRRPCAPRSRRSGAPPPPTAPPARSSSAAPAPHPARPRSPSNAPHRRTAPSPACPRRVSLLPTPPHRIPNRTSRFPAARYHTMSTPILSSSWHRLGPRGMPLEAKRSRHVAVAIPEVRVSRGIVVSPRPQSWQPQQPDLTYHQTLFGWRGRS